jgi:hypothetical protein
MKRAFGASSLWGIIDQPFGASSLWGIIDQPFGASSLWGIIDQPFGASSLWGIIDQPFGASSLWRMIDQPVPKCINSRPRSSGEDHIQEPPKARHRNDADRLRQARFHTPSESSFLFSDAGMTLAPT